LVAGLLVSSSIVEYTFGLPGIGMLLVQSVDTFDFQVVQALTLLIVVAFVIVNTIVDLLYPIIDPRMRALEAAR
jgi:peptide/nickel transport system permease protein